VRVEHAGDPGTAPHVVVTYAKGNRLYRVSARSVVVAGRSWTAKHIVHDLPAGHRAAYAQFYRSPCLMANNRRSQLALPLQDGIVRRRWFGGLGDYLSVRKMALVGNQPRTSVLTHRRCSPSRSSSLSPALSIAEQGSRDARCCSARRFAHYERAFREQLADMFAPADSIRAETSPASFSIAGVTRT